MITESLVLGLAGGAVGLLLSAMILGVAPAVMPARTIPEPLTLALDWRLAKFAVSLTVVTAVVVGVVPAWHAVRVPLTESVSAGGRGATDGAGWIRTGLAAIQIAAALLLLVGSGLFVRTLAAMNRNDPGFRGEHVVTMAIGRAGMSQSVLESFFQAIEVSGVPGVRMVGLTSDLPLDGQTGTQPFTIVGDPPVDEVLRTNAHFQIITPRYFATMGMTLLQGRAFTERDNTASVPVCIVNEEFARRHFSGRTAVGSRISVPSITSKVSVDREIVGIVRQIAIRPGEVERPLEIYVPLAQNAWGNAMLAVRTDGEPSALVPAIKAAIARVDRNQTVSRLRTMEQVAAEATARPRFRAQLVSAFAAVAAALAAAGIFSLVMFTVQQRRREFGLRLALGGSPRDVFRLVLRYGLRLIAAGLAIGLVASAILVRFIRSLLFGVEAFDAAAFVAAVVVVVTVAMLSCLARGPGGPRESGGHTTRGVSPQQVNVLTVFSRPLAPRIGTEDGDTRTEPKTTQIVVA
ncbi:MAG: FtsX-like permease family protein [Acidobacteriota bacterium]